VQRDVLALRCVDHEPLLARLILPVVLKITGFENELASLRSVALFTRLENVVTVLVLVLLLGVGLNFAVLDGKVALERVMLTLLVLSETDTVAEEILLLVRLGLQDFPECHSWGLSLASIKLESIGLLAETRLIIGLCLLKRFVKIGSVGLDVTGVFLQCQGRCTLTDVTIS
jgi:hypothetical protein